METTGRRIITLVVVCGSTALALAGCASDKSRNEVLSEAQPGISIPTAIPLETLLPATSEPISAPPSVVEATTAPAIEGPSPVEQTADHITLMDLRPGDQLQLIEEIPIPRVDFGTRLAFSPAGNVLLHSGLGLRIEQFDLATHQPMTELLGFERMSPMTISISQDGSAVAADDGNQVRIWDRESGQMLSALNIPPVSSLANAGFHADRLFYTVDFNGNVVLWDPRGWNETMRFSYPGRIEFGMLYPDGESIALQDRDRNQIAIYDLTGAQLKITTFTGSNARLLSVSPEGDRFLLHIDVGLPGESVVIISAVTGERLVEVPLLNFRRFAISADWKVLAAIGVANELRLYQLPAGSLLLAQELPLSQTLGLELSPDGGSLALIGRSQQDGGGVIQVWGPSPDTP